MERESVVVFWFEIYGSSAMKWDWLGWMDGVFGISMIIVLRSIREIMPRGSQSVLFQLAATSLSI
jgi:predicted 3-demethylubiquinone-9 3-methyltransferase (glyoxalase superfamily)